MKIKGADDLVKRLSDVENLDTKLKNVIKNNTAALQSSAQRGAPVDTGYMKGKITQSIEDAGMTGSVKSEAPYSIHVEFGTFRQLPQPFMRPALNLVIPKFKGDVYNVLRK